MSDEFVKRLVFSCVLAATAVPGAAAAQAAKPATREAEPLGRMFFTPAQRAQLDVARTQRARTTLATEQTEEVVTAAPVPQTITYDGMVRRSDGKTTVWINSRPVNDKETAGAAIVGRVHANGAVSLQVPQSGRSVELKPGQSIELLSGAIEEGFSRKPPAAVPEPKPAAKPASPGRVSDERDREEQQRKLEEAVRTLQEAAAPKPGTAPAPPPAQNPR